MTDSLLYDYSFLLYRYIDILGRCWPTLYLYHIGGKKKYAEYTEEGSKEPKISSTRRDGTLGDPRPDVPKSNKYALGLLCCASHYIHFVMLLTEKSHCPE